MPPIENNQQEAMANLLVNRTASPEHRMHFDVASSGSHWQDEAITTTTAASANTINALRIIATGN